MQQLPIPTIRTAPPEVLAGLRAVDATVEMIYLGDGNWAVMRLRPLNDARLRIAHGLMAATVSQSIQTGGLPEREWYRRLRNFRMALMGYTHIAAWHFNGDPDQRCVRDLEWRAWKLRHDIPYDDQLAFDDARRDKARAELLDPYAAAAASRSLRNPVSLTMTSSIPVPPAPPVPSPAPASIQ